MSIYTVKRTFAKLEKQSYLMSGNFNKDSRDKTKWYTINKEKLFNLYQEIEFKKQETKKQALAKNVNNLEMNNAMSNALMQNAPMQECKMTKCKSSDCSNVFMQNDPMQECDLPQPLPEITTKNSTEITSDISKNPSIINYKTLDFFSFYS